MNTANFPAMILALSLPCAAAPAPAPEYSAKHKETASKLAVQQDELQADTSDLILGETNEEVVELLKKCRHAMNDAVDLLEVYNTGGQTLAAQSDVIELIYQAAKAKMTGADGQPKPGGRALMDMLRQLLGMDHDAQSAEQQEGDEKGQEGSQKGSGNNSGRGTNGKSNMASSQDKGVSNPDTAVETPPAYRFLDLLHDGRTAKRSGPIPHENVFFRASPGGTDVCEGTTLSSECPENGWNL